MTALTDRFGRTHRDLRLSVTDRCSLRCRYCMPADGLPWAPAASVLTAAEFERLVGIAAGLGIEHVRLTGGEPLLRPDIVEIVERVAALSAKLKVSMTTNGVRLAGLAHELKRAGLCRVNISLDTLDARTFTELTLRNRHVDVLRGIDAALSAGLAPIKINAVLVRGINDHEAPAMLKWALDRGLRLRFIEQMPLDAQHAWDRSMMVTREDILGSLRAAGYSFSPAAGRGSAPAEEFVVDHGPGRVGIVGSVTRPFCADCDRVRLSADGAWRSCLFAAGERDLRGPMRAGASDRDLRALMVAEVRAKLPGHAIGDADFQQPDRPMSAIGG